MDERTHIRAQRDGNPRIHSRQWTCGFIAVRATSTVFALSKRNPKFPMSLEATYAINLHHPFSSNRSIPRTRSLYRLYLLRSEVELEIHWNLVHPDQFHAFPCSRLHRRRGSRGVGAVGLGGLATKRDATCRGRQPMGPLDVN